jgi:hypothetical protein
MSVAPASVACVRLRFDPGDDGAYLEARDALLDDLRGWLDSPDSERDAVVSDVEFFLDWRYRDSTGVLDEFAPGEVAEFLLEWCPRRLNGRDEAAGYLCFAIGVYVDFMAATGRLIGGVDRAARLRRLVDSLAPTVLAETREPTPVGDLSDEEPEPYELPFVHFPPSMQDVETAAAAAPLLTQLDALREYLGPDGKQLTDRGNLQVADGRALVELLDTGDVMDVQLGDMTLELKSTAKLMRLNFILDVAIEAGAVRAHQRRVVPVQAWGTRAIVGRAEAVFAAIVKVGPSQSHSSDRVRLFSELHQALDDGIVHWLVPLLAEDAELPFGSFLEWAHSLVSPQLAPYWSDETYMLEEFIEADMGLILEALQEAGLVRWTHREEVPQLLGRSSWTGGTVALTALGRHVLPDHLEGAGYVLPRAGGDGDGADLIEALLSVDDTQQDALIAGWHAERPAVERVQMITEAVVATSTAASRMVGFVALDHFDIEVVEPLVRQLLDTTVAGHAALWLISRERADAATLGSFVDVGVLVDALARDVDDPQELCCFFGSLSDPLQVLEDIWRHPAPETALVLDALGNQLPDKALAKAARKAAVRHRSWMANRPGAGCQNSSE